MYRYALERERGQPHRYADRIPAGTLLRTTCLSSRLCLGNVAAVWFGASPPPSESSSPVEVSKSRCAERK